MTAHTSPKTSSQDSSSTKEKIDFLRSRINESLANARSNRRINRRNASIVKIVTIMLSAIATVLLGFDIPSLNPLFKNIAFVFSALVTTFSALEPFFNYRALWVEHELALWKFYRLRDKIDYYLAGIKPEEANMDKLNSFYNEFQSIWNDLSTSWLSYRKQEKG